MRLKKKQRGNFCEKRQPAARGKGHGDPFPSRSVVADYCSSDLSTMTMA